MSSPGLSRLHLRRIVARAHGRSLALNWWCFRIRGDHWDSMIRTGPVGNILLTTARVPERRHAWLPWRFLSPPHRHTQSHTGMRALHGSAAEHAGRNVGATGGAQLAQLLCSNDKSSEGDRRTRRTRRRRRDGQRATDTVRERQRERKGGRKEGRKGERARARQAGRQAGGRAAG